MSLMTAAAAAPRVLIVEDEWLVARDLEQLLTDMGYRVVGKTDRGEDALEKVAHEHPQLVLMDIALAGSLDGVAAAQLIRAQYDVPVVFLTAYAADDVLERAKLTEPFGYILKPFSERDLRTTLAMALYKHQAEARLRNSTRQLKALSRRVLEAQEQERRRVAVELHDELGQALTAIKINLQLGQRLGDKTPADLADETIAIVESALQTVRGLATGLRPSMLDDLGLAPALKWITEQSGARAGFAACFESPQDAPRLSPDIETACFRIVQEALTNVARHAQAKAVAVRLAQVDDMLEFSVHDDGVGFDLAAMRERAMAGGSLGVLGMQERATLINGTLDICAQPGCGTTVTLRAPWRVAAGTA
ncbi:MAG: hypothetical protein Fur007_12140 [Rhodoferax sp.]